MQLEPGTLALVNLGNRLSVDVIDHVDIDNRKVIVQFQVNGWASVDRVWATRSRCPDGENHWITPTGAVDDEFAAHYWGSTDVRP